MPHVYQMFPILNFYIKTLLFKWDKTKYPTYWNLYFFIFWNISKLKNYFWNVNKVAAWGNMTNNIFMYSGGMHEVVKALEQSGVCHGF